MTMADVFTVVFIFVGFLLALPATWLLFSAIAPRGVARAQYRARRMPIVAFFVGLGTIALFAAAVAGLAATSLGPLQTLAFLVAASGMAFTMYGVSGVARQIGAMLPSAIDRDNPWRSHLRGGVVLELSFLIPILGWFLILPATLIVGAGAAALSILLRGVPECQLSPAPDKVGAAL